MRISVALCSFNGGPFLAEQLASISAQIRRPDELVVCDDASADGSADVARAFARAAPFPVRVDVNPVTLGSTPNFDRAVGLCTGDVIALCDQDDVWHPHKLAALEAVLRANPAAGFAFSDAAVTDERLTPLGHSLWDALPFRRRDRDRFRRGHAFEVLLRRNYVTGATTAFRAEYRELVRPIPPGWTHDAWVALVLSAVAPCVVIDEPLVRYRQHAGQQIGGRPRGVSDQYRTAAARTRGSFEAVVERFAEAQDRLAGVPSVDPARLRLLAAKVAHARRRAALRAPGVWRLPRVLGEAIRGNYGRFSCGWKCVAQDLFLP